MRAPRIDVNTTRWQRSSYSNQDGGNCVEISTSFPGVVPVRDSKNPQGPILTVSSGAWSRFVHGFAQADG
ncbi:hypothetical protein GCM10018785_30880 [Streptomyces longispororuber]|uniref:DUF397 domain-containing protein n=1 Tax=Streptomyces longispororuber TaxID=68230 RepID=A0A918ZLH5_9ACTN|nr:DUF397 domain-containing protein [Streptomyces longispororuber]GHE59460.1 hypothetical protein GCM10018785_30880 [Streptomyces longispororuber]